MSAEISDVWIKSETRKMFWRSILETTNLKPIIVLTNYSRVFFSFFRDNRKVEDTSFEAKD